MDGKFFSGKTNAFFTFLSQESKNTVKTWFWQHWGAKNQLFDRFYKVFGAQDPKNTVKTMFLQHWGAKTQ